MEIQKVTGGLQRPICCLTLYLKYPICHKCVLVVQTDLTGSVRMGKV